MSFLIPCCFREPEECGQHKLIDIGTTLAYERTTNSQPTTRADQPIFSDRFNNLTMTGYAFAVPKLDSRALSAYNAYITGLLPGGSVSYKEVVHVEILHQVSGFKMYAHLDFPPLVC